MIFNNSDFILKLSSLVPNVLGCYVMYLIGASYNNNESIRIGQTALLISALSSFLIYFALIDKTYSLVFLLATLILLFSIKMYENPSKKNAIWISILSILLILAHTIGFVFVLFNMFGLMAFKITQNKGKGKKKNNNNDNYFISALSMIVLALPIIPYLLKMFSHPTWVSRWWTPFDWSNLCWFITDLFSPVLKAFALISQPIQSFYNHIINSNSINFGFVLFAIVPSIIALILIIKANTESKKINKYFLCVFLSSFLTVLIAAIAGKIPFVTKYFIELYPILILMASIGFSRFDLKAKIILATTYIFMTLFYIITSNLLSITLI